jgi:hypothetical protein
MSQVEPFWQKTILEAIGSLVGVVVGTLFIGMFAAHITQRTQRRREEYQLREQLVTQMTFATVESGYGIGGRSLRIREGRLSWKHYDVPSAT